MEELDKEIKRRGLKLSLFTGVPMDTPGFNMDEALRELKKQLEG